MTVKHERHLLHFAGSIQGYLILIFVLPFGLAGVDVLPSPLSGTHKIVEVIFGLYQLQHRLHREVLREGGCDRGIPVPCDKVALAAVGYHPATLIPATDGQGLDDFWIFEGLLRDDNEDLHVTASKLQ